MELWQSQTYRYKTMSKQFPPPCVMGDESIMVRSCLHEQACVVQCVMHFVCRAFFFCHALNKCKPAHGQERNLRGFYPVVVLSNDSHHCSLPCLHLERTSTMPRPPKRTGRPKFQSNRICAGTVIGKRPTESATSSKHRHRKNNLEASACFCMLTTLHTHTMFYPFHW